MIFKNAARDIIETQMKLGPKALDILLKIRESIELYYDLFYNFSFEKANLFAERGCRQNSSMHALPV